MPYTLTTPLYYVNDRPHLGSTYTTLACDALARFERLLGEKVTFVTGVDEHGQKIQRTAERQQLSPQDHCDRVSSRYRDLWNQWGISDDRFVRTTNPRHLELVGEFYERVKASGDIVVGKQTGWYCVDCEEYKDDPAEAESPPVRSTESRWNGAMRRTSSSVFPAINPPLKSWWLETTSSPLPADARKCAISSPKAYATSPFHG